MTDEQIKSKPINIEEIIKKFQEKNSLEERYCSFDFCYNYFLKAEPEDLLNDIEKSCLVLGFYLGSWGMLRGSSFLLQKSLKYYTPTIKYIAELKKSNPDYWKIDIDNYNNDGVLGQVCHVYDDLKKAIIPKNEKNDNEISHLTLITKIMLGVFGNTPAFDQYFCNAMREFSTSPEYSFDRKCGFRRINKNSKSLEFVHHFYMIHKAEIDRSASIIYTKDFSTGKDTQTNYTKAKIIDMIGFQRGLDMSSKPKL